MTMTDTNSTLNNGVCDFEERSLMPVPMVIAKVGLGGNENDDDNDSETVSSLSSDENEPAESSSSTSSPASDCLCESSNVEEAPRLLFPKYWTKTGEESPQRSRKRIVVVTSSPPERSSSPHCVMRVNDRNPIAGPSCDDDTTSFHQEQQPDQNRPRSLFSQYWTKTGEVAPSSLQSSSASSRPVSPQSVRDPLPDPFAVFGLLEDDSENDDEFSTNTYERMISHYDVTPRKTKRNSKTRRPYESKPLFWSSWFTTTSTPKFSASAPSLSRRAGGLLASMTSPGFGSAPALQTKPLPSVLRKGRFSGSSKMGGSTFSNPATPNRRSVHFQPQVQVQSYQPPVESWAADGWSSWFGV